MEELSGIFLLPSFGIFGWQAYHWLKDGFWTPLPISTLFTYNDWPLPQVSWHGVQKIIDWLLDTPSSLVAFLLGILVVIGALVEGLLQNSNSGKDA